MELIQAQERRCTGNGTLSRQLLQVAGTVLLDIEITVKLIVQGKVSRAPFLWCINIYVTGPNICCQETGLQHLRNWYGGSLKHSTC